ncbi:unnamed protein product [Schistosoma curassoni]|uniref:Reverse transcriptase domain-containing protein n=1 Tax=Schistosoma curassoni TaxID=6186 RepID=A0A183JIV6_9TREM|nr:unnamed protein product [Schistosoma curassoni]
MKQLHDTTNKLAGKYSKPERPVKDKENEPITEIQQQRNRWVEYFEEILNRPAPMNPPEIEATHRSSHRCQSTDKGRNQNGWSSDKSRTGKQQDPTIYQPKHLSQTSK